MKNVKAVYQVLRY